MASKEIVLIGNLPQQEIEKLARPLQYRIISAGLDSPDLPDLLQGSSDTIVVTNNTQELHVEAILVSQSPRRLTSLRRLSDEESTSTKLTDWTISNRARSNDRISIFELIASERIPHIEKLITELEEISTKITDHDLREVYQETINLLKAMLQHDQTRGSENQYYPHKLFLSSTDPDQEHMAKLMGIDLDQFFVCTGDLVHHREIPCLIIGRTKSTKQGEPEEIRIGLFQNDQCDNEILPVAILSDGTILKKSGEGQTKEIPIRTNDASPLSSLLRKARKEVRHL